MTDHHKLTIDTAGADLTDAIIESAGDMLIEVTADQLRRFGKQKYNAGWNKACNTVADKIKERCNCEGGE